MTIPALLRAYASEFGFPDYDPAMKRWVDPVRRRVMRLVCVVSRRPTIGLLFDSDIGTIRFGQERVGCRPRRLSLV